MKITVLVLVGILLIVGLCLGLTTSHWWKQLSVARATGNGDIPIDARVYRSRNGELLIHLRSQGPELYIIRPEKQQIGMTNPSNFFIVPWVVYSRSAAPPFAQMNVVKSIAPDLIVQQRSVEFNSVSQGRVRIAW